MFAEERLKSMSNSTYNYSTFSENGVGFKTGIGKVINCVYDKSIKCDIISILDLSNNETIVRNEYQFNLKNLTNPPVWF